MSSLSGCVSSEDETFKLITGNEPFFHGRLEIHVKSAKNLPDTDGAFNLTDPYVVCQVGSARLLKTKYVEDCINPQWNEKFDVFVCHYVNEFNFKIMDKDTTRDDLVGLASVKAADVLTTGRLDDWKTGKKITEGWYDLKDAKEQPIVVEKDGKSLPAQINVSIRYISKLDLHENTHDMQKSYFPLRESCKMIMYQDADTPPELPQLKGVLNPDGSQYRGTRAWRDIYDSIKNAKKFIYITGWSVYTGIKLLRGEEDTDGRSNVGELLKAKAEEGVKVLMLVWDEFLSGDIHKGLMGTHDEETREYFKGTAVDCVVISRGRADGKDGGLADLKTKAIYTHHQKTIICDAEVKGEQSKRQIVAFIGGLDITDGRYDSPEFQLFKTLKTDHKGDFHSKCFPDLDVGHELIGPRQPWHDIHAKVEGPIAKDICKILRKDGVSRHLNVRLKN